MKVDGIVPFDALALDEGAQGLNNFEVLNMQRNNAVAKGGLWGNRGQM